MQSLSFNFWRSGNQKIVILKTTEFPFWRFDSSGAYCVLFAEQIVLLEIQRVCGSLFFCCRQFLHSNCFSFLWDGDRWQILTDWLFLQIIREQGHLSDNGMTAKLIPSRSLIHSYANICVRVSKHLLRHLPVCVVLKLISMLTSSIHWDLRMSVVLSKSTKFKCFLCFALSFSRVTHDLTESGPLGLYTCIHVHVTYIWATVWAL